MSIVVNNLKDKKITKDTNIAELIFTYPKVEELMMDYGLHCAGCIASGFDTLELGAKVHQMPDEDIQEMVERINEFIEHDE